MDVRDEESMKQLEECFNIDLNDEEMLYLIAITQYVDNEDLVT